MEEKTIEVTPEMSFLGRLKRVIEGCQHEDWVIDEEKYKTVPSGDIIEIRKVRDYKCGDCGEDRYSVERVAEVHKNDWRIVINLHGKYPWEDINNFEEEIKELQVEAECVNCGYHMGEFEPYIDPSKKPHQTRCSNCFFKHKGHPPLVPISQQ